jgi:N-acyl amino acid synthase of PEP-CTERM/exosortase system
MNRTSYSKMRYLVFCEENNCDDAAKYPDKRLKESYDDWAVHYLLRHKPSGEIAGGVSVVLPDREKPLQHFPIQSVCDHPLVHLEGENAPIVRNLSFCSWPRISAAVPKTGGSCPPITNRIGV